MSVSWRIDGVLTHIYTHIYREGKEAKLSIKHGILFMTTTMGMHALVW